MNVPKQISTAQAAAADLTVHLRVLATTDLHAHLLPFDYFTDKRDPGFGLACLGEMIAAARETSDNVVLFDNGDTLQGAPLADAAVAEIVPAGRTHPMIAAMNALGYDAATLGNHDFDFGLPHLMASFGAAKFPVVSSNSHRADDTPFLPPRCMLTRDVTDAKGTTHVLRIGVTGAVPPQVAQWNKLHLQGQMTFGTIVESLTDQVTALRAEGADIVVVLAHTGYGALDAGPGAENVALQVAQIPGVDAVVAGHTHKVRANAEGTGAPIVQPGAYGSHLGCIDLVLECPHPKGEAEARGWQVRQSDATTFETTHRRIHGAVPVRRILTNYPELRREVARDHNATRAFVARPLGATAVPLETFFSVIAPCAATQVIADAQMIAAEPLIAAQPALAGLPILSAVAPFKAGGRSGPRSYTDVPAGPLKLRHAADLYLYPNMLSVLRITGQGLREWLERSASLFHRIDPQATGPQPLIDHYFAPYNFDRITGLRYDIDVSQPARTNAEGDKICKTAGRIQNLTLADGRALAPEDEALVITNSYRAAGGGHMHAAQAADEVLVAQFSVRDAIARYISDSSDPVAPVIEPTFAFTPLGGVGVVFETGPKALQHPARIAALGLTSQAEVTEGFQPFKMTL